MRVVSSPDLHDLIDIRVDPEAEPADWDAAVARFLLAFVRKQATRSAGTAAAEPVDLNSTSAADERQQL